MPEPDPARKTPLAVTAAILWRGGRLLLARRTRPEWLAGCWEFPGGKIEPGESPEGCLARELHEELGVEVRVGALLCRTRHAYPELEVELQAYEVEWVAGEPQPCEHDAIAWVLPAELASYRLAPADLPIAARLAAGGIR